MTISDEQLVRSVREDVAARPGAGLPFDDVLRAGRRRVARRRAGVGAVLGVLAVAAVAGSVVGLPLVRPTPPAGPSVTLTSTPATDLDDAARMRPALEQVLGDAGLTSSPGGFTVSYSRAGEHPVAGGAGAVAEAATSAFSVFVSTAHVDSGVAVDGAGCDEVVPVRPDLVRCTPEPQPDGSLVLDLEYEAGARELVLLHRTGWVLVWGQDADLDRLREVAVDPRLRW